MIAALVIGLAILAVFVTAQLRPLPGEIRLDSGHPRNASAWVLARDGTKLAVDVWLPLDLRPGETVHAVIEGTRYWRDFGITRLGRVAAMLGLRLPGLQPSLFADFFTRQGYAYVIVDVRGTGASYGRHDIEYSEAEIADYREVLDWVTQQNWSSGSAVSFGVSYGGSSAELMAVVNHPALKAAAPRYADFDSIAHLARPGGVTQEAFTDQWSDLVAAMDRNDLCAVVGIPADAPDARSRCWRARALLAGAKPVDGETGAHEHHSPNVAAAVRNLDASSDSPFTARTQVYGYRDEIQASGVPLYVITGWFDAATTNGALARFAAFSNPQSVWIGPFDHGGGRNIDPYQPPGTPSIWDYAEQLGRTEEFFRAALAGTPITDKSLNYFVLGSDQWRQTAVWPPAHLSSASWFFAKGGTLTSAQPAVAGADAYVVDFTVGTSATTRWLTQIDSPVFYEQPDDGVGPGLRYLSPPLASDQELTGVAVLDFWLESDQADGAVHAYLEDVAPDGTVVYLTEGVLRLRHRALVENPAYPEFGPAHDYRAESAIPMRIGTPERVRMGLWATSALVRKGHRISLRIVGADQTSFARVPAEGPAPHWQIWHGGEFASSLTLPMATWRE